MRPDPTPVMLVGHFAGASNRFWTLLSDAGLVLEPLTFREDRRLPEWGLGLTNLVPRPTRGIIGLTLARVLGPPGAVPSIGPQPWRLADRPVFVVPNPSGRNAHCDYAQMLDAFRALARHARRP